MHANHTTAANGGLHAGRGVTLFAALAALLLRIAGAVREHRRRRRDYRNLLTMPDRLLKDIGVTRDDVVAAMRTRAFSTGRPARRIGR